MLVLSRKIGESFIIGGNIIVTVVDIRGDKIRLGIEAPSEVSIHRQEVWVQIQRENQQKKGADHGQAGNTRTEGDRTQGRIVSGD